ncbi:YcxB family protein [Leptospira gomenensis]|uniref:YcxB family protein n=2 Tax=Leptospira gomenensis TaxID=2484974 RepID=A0A5F1Y7Z8_9LEPT|nr:YcxB family protein [Leptospira gomenensis]TGK28965.1 YcxB family protein [Leptospira gomenensis]TGK35426.1 YcxB family protein [Leptospira gomenensis]TGK40724.1 YcxB family protein [Leptospira gomenensis]TGK68432.1 YcxB family protein [Leptospira gomenensis]
MFLLRDIARTLLKKGNVLMKLSFTLNEQDIVNFNVFHFRNSKFTTRRRILFRFLIPIWVVVVFLFLNREQLDATSFLWNSPLFLFGIFWFLFSDKLYFWRLKNNVKNLLREGRNNGMIGVQNLDLSDDTLIVQNESGLFRHSLKSINRVEEGDGYLFLYVTSLSAIPIPLSVFKDSEKETFIRKIAEFSSHSV